MELEPTDNLTEEQVRDGLRALIKNGMANQAMLTLTSGVILVAFALSLGASNSVIGLLAALPPMIQIIQIPATYIVERLRKRKRISFISCGISRFCLLLMGLMPLVFVGPRGLVFLFLGLFFHTAFGAVSGCAWNSWMRDFIPQQKLGAFFSKRMAASMSLSTIIGLLAGVFLYTWSKARPAHEIHAYAILFTLGFLAGAMETFFLSQIPEPRMTAPTEKPVFLHSLASPFRDSNFLNLVRFVGPWSFAINLAVPFFTVYMLKRLGLSMLSVIGLTVLGQLFHVVFFGIWGRVSDRFSHKSVLSVSGTLYVFCILGWTFTTMPEKHFLTAPLLILIHILMGVAGSGVNLSSASIGLKLAPRGQATTYLVASNLVNSVAASVAPALGGRFADFFADRSLSWALTWRSPVNEMVFHTLDFRHWDFFFFTAFVVGLYSLHRLAFVKEVGEVKEHVVIDALLSEVTRPLTSFYKVATALRSIKRSPSVASRGR